MGLSSPPKIVLCAELDICAHYGDLNGDDDCQQAHYEAESKDVVEIPLQSTACKLSADLICHCDSTQSRGGSSA